MRAFILALAMIATPAAAAEQFDLVCKGDGETKQYRIDLESGEYCFDKCERIMKVGEVTAGMITLYDHKPTVREPATSYNTINRLTGEWRWYNYDPRYSTTQDVRGSCELQPFSGMPAAKF